MSNNNPAYADFMLKEYENISQAHFKTNEAISSFFRYYLILVALPFSILGAIGIQNGPLDRTTILSLSALFFVFSLLGFFIMKYISGQHWDAILYARTVNGIRKYFIECVKESNIADEKQYVILPVSVNTPSFSKQGAFFGLVHSFALINGSLATVAILFLFRSPVPESNPPLLFLIVVSVATFCAIWKWHIEQHKRQGQKKEMEWNGKQHADNG